MPVGAREEAVRKAIHALLSLGAAGVVWLLPPVAAATVLAGATAVALAVELLRRTNARFAHWFHAGLAPLLRSREQHRLTGATTLALGFTLAALVVPGTAAIAGILVAGIADSLAAVVGKSLGRVRYPGGKSLEGSVAFFLMVFVILLPLGSMATGGLVALGLTALEAPDLPVDDNLFLPLVAAFLAHVAYGLPDVAFFA